MNEKVTNEPLASIVFVTHDRRELLLEAIRLAQKQSVSVEVIVVDDASSDQTLEHVTALFPNVRYQRSDTSKGPCFQRNRGVELAKCEIVFLLDDDSFLVSPQTVEQTIAEFTQDVAIVAIPFKNILVSDSLEHSSPSDGNYFLPAPQACSHAVRKSLFQSVGGYREQFFYGNEETCLSIRLMAKHLFVAAGRADGIHHMTTPSLSRPWTSRQFRRNTILFYYMYTPLPLLPIRLAGATVNGIRTGIGNGSPWASVAGIVEAFALIVSGKVPREPVSRTVFRAMLSLRRAGALRAEQVLASLSGSGAPQ